MSDAFLSYVAPEPADVASPCIGLCVIGEDDLCEGCARTIDEIADWSMASSAERRAVIEELPGRRTSIPRHASGDEERNGRVGRRGGA